MSFQRDDRRRGVTAATGSEIRRVLRSNFELTPSEQLAVLSFALLLLVISLAGWLVDSGVFKG